jgi:hypothetical protein
MWRSIETSGSAFVNTVVNVLFPLKLEHFCNSRGSVISQASFYSIELVGFCLCLSVGRSCFGV